MKKRIVVGMSGASGAPLGVKVLELLRTFPDVETHLVMSRGAELTMRIESGIQIDEVRALAHVVHDIENLGASIASGSFETDGMLVVPCSVKTLAGIACGYSDNLLLRAADVTIKECRPLVLAVRESPLSAIHLENMLRVVRNPGVRIMPPCINDYQGNKTIAELEYQIAARYLRVFGLRVPDMKTWTGVTTD